MLRIIFNFDYWLVRVHFIIVQYLYSVFSFLSYGWFHSPLVVNGKLYRKFLFIYSIISLNWVFPVKASSWYLKSRKNMKSKSVTMITLTDLVKVQFFCAILCTFFCRCERFNLPVSFYGPSLIFYHSCIWKWNTFRRGSRKIPP